MSATRLEGQQVIEFDVPPYSGGLERTDQWVTDRDGFPIIYREISKHTFVSCRPVTHRPVWRGAQIARMKFSWNWRWWLYASVARGTNGALSLRACFLGWKFGKSKL